ncbi:S-adenosyl-L-methionine-dependent methyltransferase [Coniochaeta ligniaria NRRL 30616]|uniref:S-adenosyl-L-methionine-dependent methyltransferase n=1 Tax=Coniochaeta ligniaria NRRL 30616 TaxID=1408157 RepID=A0A1J7IV73_9PEZI|nr:S-adenosyl-L-methionine-dependent methyltransferase [Coniochaeta ligniaria NRRL 30616]
MFGSTATLPSHAPDTPPQQASGSSHQTDNSQSHPDTDRPPYQTGQTSYDDTETQEDEEAVAQAEEGGSIVVDSDDVGTDAGYESDRRTSASTSMASSVRDYAFENGRRYHKFREGRYNFPNDDVEQEREDMKHAMVKMLCQQLHFAPIGDHPQEILDIGTGTGIWAIEMGDQYESANVLGIDLSPIQPDWVPPNVKFMVDDVESPWLHPRNHFDYIHSRHTVMAIKDWPKLFRRSLEHLRPGGWMELQEVHHFPSSADGSMPADHPVAQYWALINQGLANLGIDFHATGQGRLASMMRECGYVNVAEKVFHIPIGTWAKNRVLKTVGLYWRTILLDGIQAIALGPLTRGCGWAREDVELFLVQVRKAYHDNSCLMYMPLHIVYGQRPEANY